MTASSSLGEGDPPEEADPPEPSPAGLQPEEVRARLERAVARVCPGWLKGFREDLVQASMVRLLRALRESEHNPVPPASYIWKVAYSVTVDEIRRLSRNDETPLDGAAEPADPGTRSSDPHEALQRRELGGAIEACLATLGEDRRLVVGFHLMGHTLAEAEQLTGWNGKRVRNLLYRGMARLRACLLSKGVRP